MKIKNKEDVKVLFKKYNMLYFENKLRTPKFSTFIGKTALGEFFYNDNTKLYVISIARNVDWTEEGLRNVMVHEMIHYYLKIKYNKTGHGSAFKKIMNEMNEKYGLNIKIIVPEIDFIGKYSHANKKKQMRQPSFLSSIIYALYCL